MKRLSNKILMITLLVSLTIGTVLIYFNGGFKNFPYIYNAKITDLKTVKESTIPINNLKSINTNSSFGDIDVNSYSGKDIKVKIEINKELNPSDYNISINKSGEALDVTLSQKSSIKVNLNINSTAKVSILIPKNYASDMKIKSSSGDVYTKNIKLNNFQCRLDSGNITAENLQTSTSNIENSLGDIKLTEFTGDLTAKSSSGDIDINYANFNNNLKIKASLGNIKLGLPKESKFNIDAKTSLGDTTIDFPILSTPNSSESKKISGTVNGGGHSLIIENSSGDISVLKNN